MLPLLWLWRIYAVPFTNDIKPSLPYCSPKQTIYKQSLFVQILDSLTHPAFGHLYKEVSSPTQSTSLSQNWVLS